MKKILIILIIGLFPICSFVSGQATPLHSEPERVKHQVPYDIGNSNHVKSFDIDNSIVPDTKLDPIVSDSDKIFDYLLHNGDILLTRIKVSPIVILEDFGSYSKKHMVH